MTTYTIKRFVYMDAGIGMMANDNQGMVGMISHQQIRLLRLLAGRGAQDRLALHVVLFGDAVLSNAQRAALSRSISRLCAWNWIAQEGRSVFLTDEGRDFWDWLTNEWGLDRNKLAIAKGWNDKNKLER